MDAAWDLTLHEAQWKVFDDPHRFRVTVNGRRWGKTALAIQELIYAALTFDGEMSITSPQTVLGVLPTAVQARPILFKPLVKLFTETSLKYVVDSINLSEMRINILGKPSIRVAGANDKGGDRLRGTRIYFILMDECQDISPVVWQEVIRPALSDTPGSRALMTGTPKGTINILFRLSQLALVDPEWSFHNYPTWTNPCIPAEEVEKARASLPPRVFDQEYGAGFVNFEGQWFTELDSHNLHEDTETPPFDLVVAGVDFGDLHPAFSILGRDPREQCWYYIDGWSPNTDGKTSEPIPRKVFEDNLKLLVAKHGVQLIYCDPSRPSEILAIRDIGSDRVYKSAVAAFNGIQSGIGQVHNLIHQNRLKFCKHGATPGDGFISGQQAYDCHASYHRVKVKDVLTDEPADGDFSHIVDATRYALAVKGK